MSRYALWVSALAIAASALCAKAQDEDPLRTPNDFTRIRDRTERSAALFSEAARVLQHPRCQNCHPVSRIPTQGDDLHAHVPFVSGGPANHGVDGLSCSTCHTEHNVPTLGERIASVPGTPHWSLAPSSMAWQGLTAGEICEQLKDPARNGARSLAQIHAHIMSDPLIAWAWAPGAGRTAPPGSLPEFGALIAAWIETGARCPTD
jgi:hypothetical protein